ncbi:YraN family protein [Cellulophaga sp. E16_2]|uniref:YraN family protein n=1 Tax=unclassified Cellulophaga TaxID=2634405 RepID=UPI0013FD8288|nr:MULTISPECIES: YraN family protein [unclassified Cellulophaga]MBO0591621.1 YraN family protein [Cellulophaga sp. E16_2]
MADHNDFGKLGEQYAINYLKKNGYEIREKNYRYLKAEVDIIAQLKDTLVIVEVKSRSSGFIADLSDLIHQKKINLLVAAAHQYVTVNNLDVEVRFDIITIIKLKEGFKINHIEDAFYHF